MTELFDNSNHDYGMIVISCKSKFYKLDNIFTILNIEFSYNASRLVFML